MPDPRNSSSSILGNTSRWKTPRGSLLLESEHTGSRFVLTSSKASRPWPLDKRASSSYHRQRTRPNGRGPELGKPPCQETNCPVWALMSMLEAAGGRSRAPACLQTEPRTQQGAGTKVLSRCAEHGVPPVSASPGSPPELIRYGQFVATSVSHTNVQVQPTSACWSVEHGYACNRQVGNRAGSGAPRIISQHRYPGCTGTRDGAFNTPPRGGMSPAASIRYPGRHRAAELRPLCVCMHRAHVELTVATGQWTRLLRCKALLKIDRHPWMSARTISVALERGSAMVGGPRPSASTTP